MSDIKCTLDDNIKNIKDQFGSQNELIIRKLVIGQNSCLDSAIVYINGLVNKDMIDRDILNPLMLHVQEDLTNMKNAEEYLYKKYIAVSNTFIETDINKVADNIKRGKTALLIQNSCNFIIVDTTGGVYRSISEPTNDISLRGPREGFVENLETNLSIIRRRIKDKNLVTDKFVLGRRSQTDLVLIYLDDVVDKDFLQKIKDKINAIDVDSIASNSSIEQFIEEHPYSILPQTNGSERPDVIEAAVMEGRIAFLLSGTPYVLTYPTVFFEFFQTPEDYYGRTIQSLLIRIVRFIAVFILISISSMYITMIKFNAEGIPINYVTSLIQARSGIALTPFMSLVAMKLTIELLREGGMRLPSKIGQTLSVVGGIIIGDAVIQAKIVSSSTLLVAGIETVASFAIPNYQMSIAIRFLTYPMIIMANWFGSLGLVLGWFFIIAYLCSLENFGVPYFEFHKSDMKDIFARAPLWKMNKRPEAIPHNDDIRQSDFRGDKNE